MNTVPDAHYAVHLSDDNKDAENKQIDNIEADAVPTIDPVAEKKLVRKLDMLVMPTVMLLYLFSALDRGNLGNLRLLGFVGKRGLPADPDGSKYALLVAVFFVGYSILVIPFGIIAKRLDRPYLQIFVAAALWGVAASVSGAVHTWKQAIGTRFLLSVGESAYQPVVALMLAKWYTRSELALRFVLFYSTSPVSGVLNGLIGYSLNFTKSKIAPWRLLYIIDGTPTLVLAIWALWSLPSGMHNTKRFTTEQRDIAHARLARRGTVETKSLKWRQMLSIFWSWPIVIPAIANMCATLVAYVISIFLPVIIKDSGYSGAIAQLYTLPAYGSALVSMLLCGYMSDKTGKRSPFVIFAFLLMTLGCAMLAGIPVTNVASNRNARFAGLCFMANGSFIIIPMKMVWLSENSGNESRRSVAIPFILALGQAISAASGYLFPESDAPAYKPGTFACLGISVVGLACSVLYLVLCLLVNRRRDEKEGKPALDFIPDTAEDADKAFGFRYRW